MKTLSVILNVRKNSSRCQNKLLRRFSNTTLIDIALSKVALLKCDGKFLCAYDDEFENKPRDESIIFIKRSLESVSTDGPLTTVFEAVKTTPSEFFMFLNPCCAHIKTSTLQRAIDIFVNNKYMAMTSVERTREWIYNEKKEPIVVPGIEGDTKRSPVVFRVAHVFHIINKKRFFGTDTIWLNKENDPSLFEIDKSECLDIDDEFDFFVSEAVYDRKLKGGM